MNSERFLSRVLVADGVVSGACGLGLVVAPAAIATLIGLRSAALVAAVGVGLLAYAAALVAGGRGGTARRTAAVAVALNVAWLVGTVVVIVAGWLNREGNWALILVGDVVLVFALLEGVGWRKTAGLTPVAEGRG
jgi:hypothetical protein